MRLEVRTLFRLIGLDGGVRLIFFRLSGRLRTGSNASRDSAPLAAAQNLRHVRWRDGRDWARRGYATRIGGHSFSGRKERFVRKYIRVVEEGKDSFPFGSFQRKAA